jgi:protein ImuB
VQQRFGTEGVHAHRRARALSPHVEEEKYTILPERELSANITFESPVDNAEQLGFACAALAEQFVSSLRTDRLVCTGLRIELTDDTGSRHEREWLHPRYFSTADTVGRIRWQASAMTSAPERSGAGVVEVRITPTHTDQTAAHEPGLWSSEPHARVHHLLSRIQSKLGHAAVGTLELEGGRLLNERQSFVPWSTQRTSSSTPRASAAGAWPGSLTAPLPSQVFPTPLSAELLDATGHPIIVDTEDLLSAIPARLRVRQQHIDATVINWSKPWVIRERWWQNTPPRFRAQVELKNGDAWLLLLEREQWFAEGRYA